MRRPVKLLPDRPMTGAEVGMVVAIVAMIVLCCLGAMVLGVFVHPAPAPVYQVPIPTPSY